MAQAPTMRLSEVAAEPFASSTKPLSHHPDVEPLFELIRAAYPLDLGKRLANVETDVADIKRMFQRALEDADDDEEEVDRLKVELDRKDGEILHKDAQVLEALEEVRMVKNQMLDKDQEIDDLKQEVQNLKQQLQLQKNSVIEVDASEGSSSGSQGNQQATGPHVHNVSNLLDEVERRTRGSSHVTDSAIVTPGLGLQDGSPTEDEVSGSQTALLAPHEHVNPNPQVPIGGSASGGNQTGSAYQVPVRSEAELEDINRQVWVAAGDGNLAMAEYALTRGAHPDSRHGAFEETPLIRAAAKGHHELVLCLLRHGANVNLHDKYKYTALIEAVKGGSAEIVRDLTIAGASANMQDIYGNGALIYAAKNGDLVIMRILINVGARPNLTNIKGETAKDFTSWWKSSIKSETRKRMKELLEL